MDRAKGCGITIRMKYGATVCGNEYRGVPMRCDECEAAAGQIAGFRLAADPTLPPGGAEVRSNGRVVGRIENLAFDDQSVGGDHVSR